MSHTRQISRERTELRKLRHRSAAQQQLLIAINQSRPGAVIYYCEACHEAVAPGVAKHHCGVEIKMISIPKPVPQDVSLPYACG